VLPLVSGPVKLIALALAAASATPLTVLPRPRFNAPAHAPKPSRVHFVLVSSRLAPPGRISVELRGPCEVRGVQSLIWTGELRICGRDGATGRYVVSPGRYAFDFAKYAWPPRYVRSDKEFVYEQVVWAKEAGDTLYVETAHLTYAYSSYGLNAYVNAVDLKARKLRWRSPALVANADNFVIAGRVIVSAYGFTKEPDYLYALDRANGHVLARLLLPNRAEHIALHGRTLDVHTYDHHIVARLVGA
jgi:hypothetical protein